MSVSQTWSIVLMSFSLAGCWPDTASEEGRKALVGLWMPQDGSRHTIEFKNGGVFDFVYDVGPPRTVLRVKWSLTTKGKVNILQDDGSHYKTCRYSIDNGKLAIDDGDNRECLRSATTPTTLMPTAFTRNP